MNFIFYKIPLLLLLVLFSCSKAEKMDNEIIVENNTVDINFEFNGIPEAGQIIATIDATTSQGNLTFLLKNENPVGALKVENNNGIISVLDKNLFNYLANPTISATVEIINENITENVELNITPDPTFINNDFNGDITLSTQEEVDNFTQNLYTKINGNLRIGVSSSEPGTNISDLTPLVSLYEVTGELEIINNPNLISLRGLNNLQKSGSLNVFINSNLNSLNQLESLEEITSSNIRIYQNNSLENLYGLESISYIPGQLDIYNNTNLNNLDGIENITSIQGEIYIYGNTSIENIDALSGLTDFANIVTIGENPSLLNINGLSGLDGTVDGIILVDNNLIENLDAFSGITSLGWVGVVLREQSLNNLNGLSNVQSIDGGHISIKKCHQLYNLEGLDSITISSELVLEENNNLTSLNGLSNLTSIGHGIFIRDNPNLQDLNDLDNLLHIENVFFVDNNPSLSNYCAIQNAIINSPSLDYTVTYNLFNPTKQDIIEGNCSL